MYVCVYVYVCVYLGACCCFVGGGGGGSTVGLRLPCAGLMGDTTARTESVDNEVASHLDHMTLPKPEPFFTTFVMMPKAPYVSWWF